MFAAGFDIGTTNIAAVAIDLNNGSVVFSKTVKNDSVVGFDEGPGTELLSMQNVTAITGVTLTLFSEMATKLGFSNIGSVGFTGQMHGVLYVDGNLEPASFLTTWQDRRGNLPYKNNKSYAEYVSSKTGFKVSSGYGSVTYLHDLKNGIVPQNAVSMALVYDYVACILAGAAKIETHPQSAASLGLFDLKTGSFDKKAIRSLGLDPGFFPKIAKDEYHVIGRIGDVIPVTVGIGDNQASVIGSLSDPANSVLVNVGTGSQVSVVTDRTAFPEGIELRPYVSGKYLAVGSSLCGGKALDVLADFIGDASSALGGKASPPYDIIAKLAEEDAERSPLLVDTKFSGSRTDPGAKGSIGNITADNLTLKNITCGFLDGISGELLETYEKIASVCGKRSVIACSGGAVRKNPALRARIERDFGGKVKVTAFEEEAAFGAALYGACGAGFFKDINEASKLIVYKD